jgi:hypothetical protein
MANNIVAYVGVDSFDTILYLSRILHRLGRSVLVVDNSDTLALTHSVPRIRDIDTNETTISNRRVDFTNMPLGEELITKYDDILIDCGLKKPMSAVSLFTRVIYITDMFGYNIHRVANMSQYYTCNCDKLLLIRNVVYTKVTPEQVTQRINQDISVDKVSVLYRDDDDYENTLNNHVNQVFTLKLSKPYKNYLIDQVNSMCPIFTKREIRKAYKVARNGD